MYSSNSYTTTKPTVKKYGHKIVSPSPDAVNLADYSASTKADFYEKGADIKNGVYQNYGKIITKAGATIIIYSDSKKIGTYKLGSKAKSLTFTLNTKKIINNKSKFKVTVKVRDKKRSKSVKLTPTNLGVNRVKTMS
ncbi:DUF2911 domain-containing protein [Periweissella cryptocerci]|uniref:DUF2911 domain-containing protein n=1 Tax=Periweissella cryptocerci TaxID=2506420 RepID=A0A4P6YV61_9LACO|nr:DUF2911 domain-containing protein [Periweissella cryptocerci]QBO36699.1 DUF2911 domain-containing protein [Periweissella cryptocerci]